MSLHQQWEVGVKRIFARSIENRNLCYTSYYGDGDSKAYEAVKFIYDTGKPVQNFECIGHHQKRIGCRLRKLKKGTKGLKELTRILIDKLQNYFGIALRANCTTVDTTMCYMLNKRRKYLATYKSKDSTKKARKIIRTERKNKGVIQKQTEGTVYKAGAF